MIWFFALFFAVVSNSYFGWNWTPQSPEELICDGIVIVLIAVAVTNA